MLQNNDVNFLVGVNLLNAWHGRSKDQYQKWLAIMKDKKNNISCFEYINERKTKNNSSEIEASIYQFICSIYNNSNSKINIRYAKESFFSLIELISHIKIRINDLKKLKIAELKEHLFKIENQL